jgi:hypothetical protein
VKGKYRRQAQAFGPTRALMENKRTPTSRRPFKMVKSQSHRLECRVRRILYSYFDRNGRQALSASHLSGGKDSPPTLQSAMMACENLAKQHKCAIIGMFLEISRLTIDNCGEEAVATSNVHREMEHFCCKQEPSTRRRLLHFTSP